jgi:hypothetical protein
MNTRFFYGILCTLTFVSGLLFFCIYQDWLIIYWNKPVIAAQTTPTHTKKTITLFIPGATTKWKQETVSLIWQEELAPTAHAVAKAWLTFAQEEQLISEKVRAVSVCASPSQEELYINFSHSPFLDISTAHAKYHLITSFLETIKATGLTCSSVYFLVRHQPLTDIHIDCSVGWQLI